MCDSLVEVMATQSLSQLTVAVVSGVIWSRVNGRNAGEPRVLPAQHCTFKVKEREKLLVMERLSNQRP